MMACLYLHNVMLTSTSIIMKFIVWIINDIHMEFNDIHWEGCLHITRRFIREISTGGNFYNLCRVGRQRLGGGCKMYNIVIFSAYTSYNMHSDITLHIMSYCRLSLNISNNF